MVRYIVFGGSGRLGRVFTRQAVQQGNKVVSIIRDPDQAREIEQLGATVVLLDISSATVKDIAHVLRTTSPDAVVWTAGSPTNEFARVIDHDAQLRVVDAIQQAKVRRLLTVSSIGVWERGSKVPSWFDGDDKKAIERLWGFVGDVLQAKYEAELELRTRQNVDWTIIRPGGLKNTPASGASVGKLGAKGVSLETVAQVMLASVSTRGMYRRTVDVLDGEHSVQREIEHVVANDIDSWIGPKSLL